MLAAFFAVAYEVPAGLVIKNGELSHSLWQFFLESRHFFLALSLKGTGNEFFDWLIIPLPIPIPFTLFSLDRKPRKRKRNRKKKELFWSFWLRFRWASDSASDFDFWYTLDHNAPCASDSDSASDSVASVNWPLSSPILFFRCEILHEVWSLATKQFQSVVAIKITWNQTFLQ